MKRRIVSCVLAASLFTGCYTTGMMTKEELKARIKQVDITLFMKDSSEYKFLEENYRIQGDSLTGFGVRRSKMSSDIVLDASLSFADIDSIETKRFDATNTILLCGGVGLGAAIIIVILSSSNQPPEIALPSAVGHP